jgi:membrane associated rhomboid family serine protease
MASLDRIGPRLTSRHSDAKNVEREDPPVIVPYSTDAPIYHYPWATLGVIATNVAVHIAWCFLPPEAAEPFAMKLGAGLHALQWLTHNFLHADIFHLAGNMIFLWSYGIIVEGKIGPFAFLLTYLGIGTAHGAAIQAAYLGASTPSYVLGASAIIFGLMAMAMIWAPKNDICCFYFFFVGFRIISGTFEWPIYVFALLQLAMEGVSVGLQYAIRGDPMSSGLLHISGAAWGLVVGIALVKLGWVDCEGWDVFSLAKKRKALRSAWASREARLDLSKQNQRLPRSRKDEADRGGLSPEERAARRLARVHEAIEQGDMASAGAVFEKWLGMVGNRAPREAFLGIIRAMHERGETVTSVPAMRALCRIHPERSEKARLKLASILLREMDRPTEARKHLLQIADAGLDPSLLKARRALLAEADRMIEDGVLEVEEDV